jgi:hypothetical protein
MQPDEKPENDVALQEARLAQFARATRRMHPDLPPRSWRETLVTFVVITLGLTLAILLAALHLGEP